MTDFQVPVLFDYAATFTWAVSGAIVAIRRQYDVTGVFIVALLSATGGGLLRDAVFLDRAPSLLTDPAYLSLICAATALTTFLTQGFWQLVAAETVKKVVDVVDAVGTPAFAIVGMQLAEDRAVPVVGVLFVGVVNGVAGGLLRDVVVRDVPALLRPGQFASLTLLATCGLYLLLTRQYDVSSGLAGWITAGVFFVLRLLTIRFNWQTRSVWAGEPPPPAAEP